jgi:hypothetical protein
VKSEAEASLFRLNKYKTEVEGGKKILNQVLKQKH